jgi:hypothetical protein
LSLLGVVVALMALWMTGAMLLSLTGLRDLRSPTRGFADLAAGVVLLATYGMTMVLIGGRVHVLGFYGVAAAVGVAYLLARPRGSLRLEPVRPRSRLAWLLLAGTVVLLLIVATAALRDRLLWDGWAFWTLKAHALLLHGTLPPALLDPAGPYYWTHPEYPLAHPLVHWWLFSHAGGFSPAVASFMGAVWLAFLPLLLWHGLERTAGERWAAATAFSATAFWPIAFQATGGYAEIILILCILGAVIELERGIGGERGGSAGRFALFLALAALSKNEGLALAVAATPLALIHLWRSGARRRAPSLWLLLPFMLLAPWFVFTRAAGLEPDQVGGALPIGELAERVGAIFLAFGRLGVDRAWTALPILILAGLAARVLRPDRDLGVAWATLLLYLLMTQLVYLSTPLDFHHLLNSTLPRIVQVLVPAVVFLSIREVALLQRGTAPNGARGGRHAAGGDLSPAGKQ